MSKSLKIKRTAKDIIGDYIDNENWIDYVSKSDEITNEQIKEKLSIYEETKIKLEKEIRNKIEKIDHVVLEVKRKEHLIDGEMEALKDEIDRLKMRRKGIGKFKDFVNKVLLPMIVEEVGNENGVWETDVARYKLYETFGPVDVNPGLVSDDFIKTEIRTSIDKVKARNAAISSFKAGKNLPDGININKVKRVRRS